jgi:hypothetical protein
MHLGQIVDDADRLATTHQLANAGEMVEERAKVREIRQVALHRTNGSSPQGDAVTI